MLSVVVIYADAFIFVNEYNASKVGGDYGLENSL